MQEISPPHDASNHTLKSKRGRPSKADNVPEPVEKRPRGRPRKPLAQAQQPERRPRGRPRKYNTEAEMAEAKKKYRQAHKARTRASLQAQQEDSLASDAAAPDTESGTGDDNVVAAVGHAPGGQETTSPSATSPASPHLPCNDSLQEYESAPEDHPPHQALPQQLARLRQDQEVLEMRCQEMARLHEEVKARSSAEIAVLKQQLRERDETIEALKLDLAALPATVAELDGKPGRRVGKLKSKLV